MVNIKARESLNHNFLFSAVTILLAVIGLLTLASTEVDAVGVFHWSDILIKQVIFVGVGVLVYFAVSGMEYSYFKFGPIIMGFYALTFILLVLTLLFGEEIKNVQRWINFGGVQVQPSEIAKITVILTTAYIFTLRNKWHEYTLLIYSLIATLPLAVLVFLQPHGSMAVLIMILWFATAFISMKNQLKNIVLLTVATLSTGGLTIFLISHVYFWLLLPVVALIILILGYYARDHWKIPLVVIFALSIPLAGIFALSWNVLVQDYQKERILSFQDEDETASFNVNQAKIAIGSGRIFGKGWGNGTQGKLNFLPEHKTDFIFASFAEEFGLVGSTFLLFLYLFLLYVIFRTAITAQVADFGAILLVMIGIKILLEVFINIGTNTGVTPATGIPLPLISAGGSITVMTFFSLGLVQSIMRSSKDVVSTYFD